MKSKQETASRWLHQKISGAKRSYIIASVFILFSAGSFALFSWHLSGYAADWLAGGLTESSQLWYALLFLAGRYILAHIASMVSYRAGNSIVSQIKTALYPLLLRTSQSDSVSSTLFVTRVSDDLRPFYSFFMPYSIASVLVGLLLLAVSFWFEFWVGLVLLLSFIVIPLMMIMIGVGAESLHQKHISLFVRYSAVFYNRLHSIAEIVNLDNFAAQHRFLSDKSKSLNGATIDVMRIAVLSSAVLELFVSIAIAAIAIYLGFSLLGIMPGQGYGQSYDFRIALFLLMLAPYFFFYLRKFVSAYHDRNKALASAQLLMPLLGNTGEAPIAPANEPLQSLVITDLSYAYPGTMVKVLHRISLSLPRTGLVLVKGISGSGKSTLLKILSGSLAVQEGALSVNANSNTWSMEWLKSHSSYMNQYPFIFDGTLRYNVFLRGGSDAPSGYPSFLDKVLAKKEAGWQSVLSHNGKQLSGGEKQLVTLARMMLFPRPVAILDEPTANLDADTAEIIIGQMAQMAQSRLVVVASHEERFDAIATTILNLNWGEQMHYE